MTDARPSGFHCPACGKRKLMTVDSRPVFGGIRRRRECNKCGFRCNTIEKISSERRARRNVSAEG